MWDSGLVQRDAVEVTLHQDGRFAPPDFLPRLVESVQHIAFAIERGLARIEVFRPPFSLQQAAAEGDGATFSRANWDDQPASKRIVVSIPLGSLLDQPR